jgi:hypothetical protein
MKVSERTHPILQHIINRSLGHVPTSVDDISFFNANKEVINEFCNSLFTNVMSDYGKIHYVSDTFYNAVNEAWDRITYIYNKRIEKEDSIFIRGVYIIKDFVYVLRSHDLPPDWEIGWDQYISFAIFHKNGQPIAFVDKNTVNKINVYWTSKSLICSPTSYEWLIYQYHTIVSIYLFQKYAQVETKIIEPHQHKKENNCKYINDTKFPITYLDSKWFTTIVKSDGFKVRGHFRLQPKIKDGKWTHELIFINDYMKSGYTSKAKILSQPIAS